MGYRETLWRLSTVVVEGDPSERQWICAQVHSSLHYSAQKSK